MSEPVLSGSITQAGVLAVLSEIEQRRTTGVLKFDAGGVSGEVEVVAGQLAFDQKELDDGRDPVEVLLGLREGRYEVQQRLPVLPVSKGDEQRREGSLAVHVPADLMNYCERAGLTGKLTFSRGERSAEAVYDRGDLVAIRVDGSDDADLHEVFGWDEGVFVIVAHAATPKLDVDELVGWEEVEEEEDPSEREPTIQFQRKRRKQDTAEIFLRSVEVALTSILEEREKRRAPTRTSPPLPPPKKARTSSAPGIDKALPKSEPPKRKEPTVRIVFLGAKGPRTDEDTGTRHVKKGAAAERALPAAARSRTKDDAMRKAETGKTAKKGGGAPHGERAISTDRPGASAPEGSAVETMAWVIAFFALVIGALALLARLPPLR
jgi:hypothetical protein